jgi:hypothetical protein
MNPCRKLIGTEAYIICLEEARDYMRKSGMMIAEFYWDVTRGTTTVR